MPSNVNAEQTVLCRPLLFLAPVCSSVSKQEELRLISFVGISFVFVIILELKLLIILWDLKRSMSWKVPKSRSGITCVDSLKKSTKMSCNRCSGN